MQVIKRNGLTEPFNFEKIKKSILWATEGNTDMALEIALNSKLSLYNNITTESIAHIIQKTVKDMISLKTPEYSSVHAKLLIDELYKNVLNNSINHPSFLSHLQKMVEAGRYDKQLLQKYDSRLEDAINYDRDMNFTSIGIEQLMKKYLLRDKVRGKYYETPQQMFMALSLAAFDDTDEVIEFYDTLSTFKVSLPTPIMVNLRTPKRAYSSCALVRTGDSVKSWIATDTAISTLSFNDNGLGIAQVDGRSVGSEVGNGKMLHYGFRPVTKVHEALLQRSRQSSRNGAATVYYTWWNKEVLEILSLKSPRKEEKDRIMSLDYGILFNDYFIKAVMEDRDVYLHSTKESPELLQAMVTGKFEEKYYPTDTVVKARDIFNLFVEQRFETGRYYAVHIDNVNNNSPFKVPVHQSNLCVTGDTKILTKEYGNIEIEKVAGQSLTCWNGTDWSKDVPIFRTDDGSGQEIYKVTLSNGVVLKTTGYHRWDTVIGVLETTELDTGTELVKWDLPTLEHGSKTLSQDELDDYKSKEDGLMELLLLLQELGITSEISGGKLRIATSKAVKVVSVEKTGEILPTYCGTNKDNNKLHFNGVTTLNCAEILLPTEPIEEGTSGEVGICVLSNINLVKTELHEFERVSYLLVKLLDNLIDLMDYPLPQAEYSSKKRRSLGIGISNFAHWLAKNGIKYGEDLNKVHQMIEAFQHSLLKASVQLAKERGKCELFSDTTYSDGVLPIDRYKKTVDELAEPTYLCDWESLRKDMMKYGLRNSTLSAIPPAQTSSQISNSTNGVEPLQQLLVRKDNGAVYSIQIAPGYPELAMEYDLSFDRKINTDYLKTIAVLQKFIDQSISSNTYFNPKLYPDEQVDVADLQESLLLGNYYGIKTHYYETINTDTEIETCASGACEV